MTNFKSGFVFLFLLAAFPVYAADSRQSAQVETALTGDTIRLKGGKELRYLGVKAYSPESKIPLEREYGSKAQAFNHELVSGKKVFLEWGNRLRDKQNRLMAYVYTEDGRFVNEEILKNGHAKMQYIASDRAHADRFRDLEFAARKARLGLWAAEPKDPNRLKRYIGDKTRKIYYLPDSPELEDIPEAYQVAFDSRVDAKAAGYRACSSCRGQDEFAEEAAE